jgi:hypothetical protein
LVCERLSDRLTPQVIFPNLFLSPKDLFLPKMVVGFLSVAHFHGL